MPKISIGTIVERAVGNRERSVIRRSLWVTFFFILGFFFYYCLILVANRQLSSADFGRFYTGWTILNIIATPGGIVVLLLAGYFGKAFQQGGKPFLIRALFASARQLVIPTMISLVLLEFGFKVGGTALGIDSSLLAILLPLVAVASFLVEVVRATFQGAMQFTRYGVYWALWCSLQLTLGSLSVLWLKAPWTVFAGMLAASVLAFVCLLQAALRGLPDTTVPLVVERLTFDHFLPFCSALLGTILFINIDILVSYLLFSPAVNGEYAASAFLTKAMITSTQPVLQIMIPLIVRAEKMGVGRQFVTLRAISVGVALTLSGAVFLWAGGAKYVCGGRYGVQYCDIRVLKLLALAAIPLTILRIWVVSDATSKRYAIAQLIYPALAIFVFLALKGGFNAFSLAVTYCFCCWGALAFRTFLQLVSIVGASRERF